MEAAGSPLWTEETLPDSTTNCVAFSGGAARKAAKASGPGDDNLKPYFAPTPASFASTPSHPMPRMRWRQRMTSARPATASCAAGFR